MHRFAIFVDGSNLYGTLKYLGVTIDDYGWLYRYVFDKAIEEWRASFSPGFSPPAQLCRIYWYAVGKIDAWDLPSPKAQTHLRQRFEEDRDVKRAYMALSGPKFPGAAQDKIANEAWASCFSEFQEWYSHKCRLLDGMKRFYHAVRARSDYIDIIECGRWKVDLLHRVLDEKGIDTSLAVDMIALKDTYDVALVISGDADMIPSINYVKTWGKHVAAVEFLKGYPPEKRGKQFSSHLKLAADFVVQIYEMDMVRNGQAKKGDVDASLDSQQELPEG